eukprot:4263693-Pleurochrysis_carterae.AAC.4
MFRQLALHCPTHSVYHALDAMYTSRRGANASLGASALMESSLFDCRVAKVECLCVRPSLIAWRRACNATRKQSQQCA